MVDPSRLSKRETDVANLLIKGKSNKQIAAALQISDSTVEFHLTNLYAKIGVGSRAEAILLLSQPGKTPGASDSSPSVVDLDHPRDYPGNSPVEVGKPRVDNGADPKPPTPEALDMPQPPTAFLALNRTPVFIAFCLLVVAMFLLVLSLNKSNEIYARECENPDQFTTGALIQRSNASAGKVLGQFGTTELEPWPAQAGFVSYDRIKLPQTQHLAMKIHYSKASPATTPISIFMDKESYPRAIFYPMETNDWNVFHWSEPIALGDITNGFHTILFYSEGQPYGVADLDKFILIEYTP